jgi:hypothetical protein
MCTIRTAVRAQDLGSYVPIADSGYRMRCKIMHPMKITSFAILLILSACGTKEDDFTKVKKAIETAERACLVGKRVTLAFDAGGGVTLKKLDPGGNASLSFNFSDAKGGQFFRDPAVQAAVERTTLGCMQSQWEKILRAADGSARPIAIVKTFTAPDKDAPDRDNSKAGRVLNMRISIISEGGSSNGKYIVEWDWTGSGGSQKGSQNLLVAVKGPNSSTIKTLPFPIDRGDCFYRANPQKYEGVFDGDIRLVSGVEISATVVQGKRGRC